MAAGVLPVVKSPLRARALIASNVARQVADSLAARVNRAVLTLRPFRPARIVHQTQARRNDLRC